MSSPSAVAAGASSSTSASSAGASSSTAGASSVFAGAGSAAGAGVEPQHAVMPATIVTDISIANNLFFIISLPSLSFLKIENFLLRKFADPTTGFFL
jgi:hypothetical protein